jgi:hypothetical protein
VPTIGLVWVDQRQPGSRVSRPTVIDPRRMISTNPSVISSRESASEDFLVTTSATPRSLVRRWVWSQVIVSVPTIPYASWPGKWQMNWSVPGLAKVSVVATVVRAAIDTSSGRVPWCASLP